MLEILNYLLYWRSVLPILLFQVESDP